MLKIKKMLIENYQSLYLTELKDLIHKARIFGFYFATLDIRQDSRVHHQVFEKVIKGLTRIKNSL